MKEFYHIHTRGTHDSMWKENSIINCSTTFNNRINKKINDYKVSINKNEFSYISDVYDKCLQQYGYKADKKLICADDLLETYFQLLSYDNNKNLEKNIMPILKKILEIVKNSRLFNREQALENYRQDYYSNLPSRLHSIYLTDQDSIDKWCYILENENSTKAIDVFSVEVYDEPFKTSEQFIPNETMSYKDMYDEAVRYWNPKFKNDNNSSVEYLYQGKLLVKKKIKEIRR